MSQQASSQISSGELSKALSNVSPAANGGTASSKDVLCGIPSLDSSNSTKTPSSD